MKKYKLLRFGHCYVNREGDLIIGLLGGNKKRGYTFLASSANPAVVLEKIHIQSRIVPNDGNWVEISTDAFNSVSAFHSGGYKVKPSEKIGGLGVITKF